MINAYNSIIKHIYYIYWLIGMFYYIIHHILRMIPNIREWSDLKLNCTTLLMGTVLHILIVGYLKTKSNGNENSFIGNLFRWYYYLIVADMVCVGVIYKEYYGRSILAEVDDVENWEWDDNKKKYKSQYQGRVDRSKEAIERANELEEEMYDTRKNLVETRDKVEEIDMAIRYHPNGEIVKEVKEGFEEKLKEMRNEN